VIALKSATPPLRAKILQQPNGRHERQHERKSQQDKAAEHGFAQHVFNLKTEEGQRHDSWKPTKQSGAEKLPKPDPRGADKKVDQSERSDRQYPYGEDRQKTMPSRLLQKPLNGSRSGFAHPILAEGTAHSIAHSSAQKPPGKAVSIAPDRTEREDGRETQQGHGKENQARQNIAADNPVRGRRVAPHGVLPIDDRFKIDPLIQRRPAPERRQRKQRQDHNQTLP